MNLVGKNFGRWVVDSIGEPYTFPSTGYQVNRYNCTCSCGVKRLVRESTLVSGESKSCSCLANENAGNRLLTHGLSRHPVYSVWVGLQKRCFNVYSPSYKHYGGRGITVSSDWLGEDGLLKFIDDMYPTYKEGLEIERVDVNGNYCKENCTWATRREQVINRRVMGTQFDTHFLEFDGKRLCISQWADETGINASMIVDRIGKLNWSIEKALTVKPKTKSILCSKDQIQYKLDDIFKHPPNISAKASLLKIPLYQAVADILPCTFEVKFMCNKQWYSVEKNSENSISFSNSIFNHEFLKLLHEEN